MCGVVGILNKNKNPIDIDELNRFNNSLSHRGPDSFGIFVNQKKSLGLGHRRLSIIDLSKTGNQPMTIQDRYTIVFNGEIYNFQILKKELLNLGYKFFSNSDTEVLIKSFIHWGENCQFKFNGMWAFAIWDNLKNTLFISRDRFGVKPIYYTDSKDNFIFCSELKAFMKLNKDKIPDFDDDVLTNQAQNYTNFSYNAEEDSILKNVKELLPGHQLKLDSQNRINIQKWWKTIENLQQLNDSTESINDRFRYLFYDSCNLRMISDVKVATSLSGGMDSSSIAAAITDLIKNKKIYQNINFPIEAYILYYVGEKKNETSFAIEVAKYLNLKANIISIKPSDFSEKEIKQIIFHQEEVTGDDGLGPWQIYKNMHKDNFKVSIDGHGGDELLGGYSGYPKIAMNDSKSLRNLFYWLDLLKIHIIMNDKHNNEKDIYKIFLSKIKSVIKNKLIKKNQEIDYTNFFYKNNYKKKVTEYDNLESLNNLNKSLYIDYHYKALSLNLKKYDKFSMAHSIETRFPFLDYRLACFSFSLPNKFKISGGYTKKILRDVMKNSLPKNITGRIKKKGFNPENSYFNNEYKKFIYETISSKSFQNENIWDGKSILTSLNNDNLNLKNIFKFIQIYYLKKTFKEYKL